MTRAWLAGWGSRPGWLPGARPQSPDSKATLGWEKEVALWPPTPLWPTPRPQHLPMEQPLGSLLYRPHTHLLPRSGAHSLGGNPDCQDLAV